MQASSERFFLPTAKKSQTAAIFNLRAVLDGTAGTQNVDDRGVGDVSAPTITNASNALNGSLLGGFPTNNPPGNNAIAYDRTTRQVLNIVYGAKNATKGLFFPRGLNGVSRELEHKNRGQSDDWQRNSIRGLAVAKQRRSIYASYGLALQRPKAPRTPRPTMSMTQVAGSGAAAPVAIKGAGVSLCHIE